MLLPKMRTSSPKLRPTSMLMGNVALLAQIMTSLLALHHYLPMAAGSRPFADASGAPYPAPELVRSHENVAPALAAGGASNSIELVKDIPPGWGNFFPPTYTVAKDGSGNFKTVQEAINQVPDGNEHRVVILIMPGTYAEKIVIPKEKPFITLQGLDAASTVLTWADWAGELVSQNNQKVSEPLGTFKTCSTCIFASHFIAGNITFSNTAPEPKPSMSGMAVALRIAGDASAFFKCWFLGWQDTLFDNEGRHYFRNCYIEGSIDFVFGDGQSIYEECVLYAKKRSSGAAGALTAQNSHSREEATGYVFIRCNVTGLHEEYLGRTWGPASRVIFAYTYLDNVITPQGWTHMGKGNTQLASEKTAFYAEYKCWGPGANRNRRVSWSLELTDAQAAPFMSYDFIGASEWLGPPPDGSPQVSQPLPGYSPSPWSVPEAPVLPVTTPVAAPPLPPASSPEPRAPEPSSSARAEGPPTATVLPPSAPPPASPRELSPSPAMLPQTSLQPPQPAPAASPTASIGAPAASSQDEPSPPTTPAAQGSGYDAHIANIAHMHHIASQRKRPPTATARP